MNFYDVLAAEKWSGGIPTINFFDLLFAQSISGGKWETYEGTLPATIISTGDNMRQYQVWGNTGGVGDKTENLIDPQNILDRRFIDANGALVPVNNWRVYYVPVTAGEIYTVNGLSEIQTSAYMGYCDTQKSIIGIIGTPIGTDSQTVTAPANAVYLAISNRYGADNPICVQGPTAPETFVPPGYKVPIGVKSGNLFDKTVAIYQKYLITDGSVVNSTPWGISDYIKVAPNTAYIIKNAVGENPAYCIYDKDKNFISGEKYNNRQDVTFVTGSNAAYVRMSLVYSSGDGRYNLDKLELCRDITTPIYIGDTALQKDEYVDYQEQKVYRRTENKYNILTQTKNSGLSVNGSTVSSTTSSRSDYIAVAPETTYTKKANATDTVNRITQFFDSSKHFLSNTTPDSSEIPQTFTTPVNCAFVRIAYPIDSTQVMLTEGSTAPAQFIPYLQPTDPPVALPALPTVDGETIVDYAGNETETTKNILPSAQAQTLTVNGNTCTCDGQGRYHVDMSNNTDTNFVFSIPDFVIPISVGQGGNGTWSMFNTAAQSMQVKLYYNDTEIDYWSVNAANRTSDSYSSMGGKTINKIIINAWYAAVDGDFAFMFTDDGVLPSEFVPHEIAKPTPEKVLLEYKKG